MKKPCGFTLTLALWVSGTLSFPVQKEILNDPPSHNRTLRELCNKGEYPYDDWCCRNCPAGSYVGHHCKEDHQPSSCASCTLGHDFTIIANGLEQCISCRFCREDEVLIHPCTLTNDAVCQCKPGTYCTPGMCEICMPCSGCSKGKRVKEHCSDTKNTVCEDIPQTQPTSNTTSTYLLPPTSTKDLTTAPQNDVTKHTNSTNEKGSFFTHFIITLVIILLLSLVMAACVWGICKLYRRGKKDASNNQNLLADYSADPSSNSSLVSLPLDRANQRAVEPRMETEPLLMSNVSNAVNEPAEQSSMQGAQSDEDPGGDDHGGGGTAATRDDEPCSNCDQLPPCDCYWTDCFHCIYNVCPELIVRIVRELHVPNNKIECIIKENPHDTYERSYKLLQLWRTMMGKQASMNNVVHVLNNMEFKGLAENLINSLRCKGITVA